MWQGKNSRGKDVVLLNPSEKAAKYSREMRSGYRETNMQLPKYDKNTGEVTSLTASQRAFRAGYLEHARDSSMAFCAKKGIKSKAKENRKKFFAERKKIDEAENK